MAWHKNRYRVRSIGRTDRPDGLRLADSGRNIGVAPGLAEWDTAEFFPDRLLKSGSANIDRKLGRLRRMLDRGQRTLGPIRDRAVIRENSRVGEAALEHAFILIERQPANTL